MASMARWAVGGGLGAFLLLCVLFCMASPHGNEFPIFAVLALGNSISAAGMFALFGAVRAIQAELRETQRQLKHWQSIQSLDIGLDESSSHITRSKSRDQDF